MRAWLQRAACGPTASSRASATDGLATGYFEPLVDASRVSPARLSRRALRRRRADLATRKPYWTRQQIETLPAAQRSLRGREIAWLRDPLDALLLQVQGSGRLAFAAERGGAPAHRARRLRRATTTSRTARSAAG